MVETGVIMLLSSVEFAPSHIFGSHLPLITCLALVLCIPFPGASAQPLDGRDGTADACDVAEYPCDAGGCVHLSHFCDGVAHCRDYSDEPPGCTVCNRTYYGFVDRTHLLKVPSTPASRSHPRGSSLGFPSTFGTGTQISEDWSGHPTTDFICILTFTAVGGSHGDIVQIIFDEFHVGHFNTSGAEGGGKEGCSGDHVMIEEPKSVFRGGRWCGEGFGLNVYFSETDTVIVTLKATTATFGEYFDNPLRFKLKYRFLRKQTAIVRYGTIRDQKYRGELVRNTACSRVFQGCRVKGCKIQSPNFPGFYPRNVTCYYLIKALPAPTFNLVPVIVLSQTNDRMMQIGQREHASRVSPESILRQDRECVSPEDYVLVYDGGAMRFPLLSKFCGTAKLTNITSSGPEMLVVFKSAGSGKMNHLANLASGFEFNINIFFMKKKANSAKSDVCEDSIKSFQSTNGVIYNPAHAMPSNSSCRYIFSGRKDEIVWLYFTKYKREGDKRMHFSDIECMNGLRIYNGELQNETMTNRMTLMGEFCNEQIPPLCVRSKEKGFVSRPCTHEESFLSTSPHVVIIQDFTHSTSLKPLEFIIHYEFVNIKETGLSLFNSSCDMIFNSTLTRTGHITAPKSLFYYGRGGRRNLFCKYKFHAKPDEAIELNIMNIKFPDRLCKTVYNRETEVYDCIARITGSAILEAFESYWNNTRLIIGCICDNRLEKINLKSFSNYVELDFIIRQMTWSQDYSDFSFEAQYNFVPIETCTIRRLHNGTNGILLLKSSENESACSNTPFRISATHTRHIYLNIPGYHGSSHRCHTNNRVVIYDSDTGRPVKAICPSDENKNSIDIFSSGWTSRIDWPKEGAVSIVFKYLAREKGTYKLKWLEVTREPRPSALESLHGGGVREGWQDRPSLSCGTDCPEITACISPKLWCDGVPHCPSGADEQQNCFYVTVPWMYVVLITVSILGLIFSTIVILIAVKVYQKGKIKRKKKKEAQRLMTQEVLLPMTYHKENINNIYLRGGGI